MDDAELNRIMEVELTHFHEPWKTGPSAIGSAKGILQGEIVLTNKSTYHIMGDVDWGYHWTSNDKTNRLYFLSMHYVGELLDAYQNTQNLDFLNISKEILKSFMIAYQNEPSKFAMTSSEDQAYYLRTGVIVKAIQTFRTLPNQREFCADLIELLIRHAEWLFDDKHHVENNHGVMTDFGLIICCTQLRPLEEKVNVWLDRANSRLLRLIQNSFDEDGMNNENSFDYQRYNIKLYSMIIEFSRHYCIGESFVSSAVPIIAKAKNAFQYLIWHDGLIPPIGDSPINSSGLISINESKWFRGSNVLIIKNDRLYFSLKCGFKIPSHKHVDESSITLRFDGKDILVDSGSYSYDRADPYRICLESTRGHTGIYPSSLDGVLASNYCRNFHASSGIDRFEEHDGNFYARCNYALKKNKIMVTREIFMDINKKELRVEDSFTSEAPELFRQQFNFHPDAIIEQDEHNPKGSNGSVLFSIKNADGRGAHFFKGEKEPVIRGWYSPKYSQLFPTAGLDYSDHSNNGNFITTLTFGL